MKLGKYRISDATFHEFAIKFMSPRQIQRVLNFDALTKREFRILIGKIEADIDRKFGKVKRAMYPPS